MHEESDERYNPGGEIKFKTMMLRSSLCDHSDVYILLKGTRTIAGAAADEVAQRPNKGNKQVSFKDCVPFTNCISKIYDTQKDNAKNLDVVMPIYNLIDYSENYAKTSKRLWQYHKDDRNDNITNSKSFKLKARITGSTPAAG